MAGPKRPGKPFYGGKEAKMKHSKFTVAVFVVSVVLTLAVGSAFAAEKPNILIIWGDDIGWFNISAYNHGMMGYKTPNIDRIANEGILFTDAYGQNSCTAGRAAFITGQSPYRTGDCSRSVCRVPRKGSSRKIQPSRKCSNRWAT